MPTADAEPGMGRGTTPAAPASPSQPAGERAVSVLWSFGKCLGALLPVYLAGYYGFSISVVLFGLMIYMGWKHSRLEKLTRLKSAMYLLENERKFTTENVFRAKRDLPPWVRTDYRGHSVQFLSPVTSATSVRLNLSCVSATLHRCRSLLRAYYSLVGACYLFRISRLLAHLCSQRQGDFLLHGNPRISMCMTALFVHSIFLLSLTSPIFRHS